MRQFYVEVICPYKPIWNGMAYYVRIPSPTGQFGVMRGHQPLVSLLAIGQVHITQTDGTKNFVPVRGGFAFVHAEKTTILIDHDADVFPAQE